MDGVELMTNDYSIGLGTVFTSYMHEAEWLKLSYPDREIAMLNAVILPNEETAPGLTKLTAADIETGVEELEYTKTDTTERGDKFVLSAESDDEHQIFVSFEGIRTSLNGRMTVRVNNGKVRKTAIDTVND